MYDCMNDVVDDDEMGTGNKGVQAAKVDADMTVTNSIGEGYAPNPRYAMPSMKEERAMRDGA